MTPALRRAATRRPPPASMRRNGRGKAASLVLDASPRHGLALPDPTPADGPGPVRQPRPGVARVDWREHLRRSTSAGPRVNYAELRVRARPAPGLRPRPLGLLAELAREHPPLRPHHRVIALDLPGFGHSPDAAWEISIPGYGRLLTTSATRSASRLRDRRQLDGRLRLRRGRDRRARAVREARAGLGRRGPQRAAAPRAGRGRWRGWRRRPPRSCFASRSARMRRPRAALGAFRGLFQHPERAAARAALGEFTTARGAAGLRRRRPAWSATTSSTGSSEVEVPTLIVWGRNDHVVPPGDALGYATAPAQLADGDLRRHAATARSSSARCASTACSETFLAPS